MSEYYIISARNLKRLLMETLSTDDEFACRYAKEIVNRQINDMIAAGDITPTIFEKE